ncbi:MAG: adenylyl cyclase class-3/4/guanylyl cyclase [Actinomycetia bacterium]|nr:adenylyl cyclase class-3/4/guanylyl cyclase [Actinomycetes bacterium]
MTSMLVGRDRELGLLVDRLDRTVSSGRGGVVVLRGEAGIGKTRLLASFAELATDRYSSEELLAGYGQAMMNSLASDSFQAVRECLRTLALCAQRSASRTVLSRVADAFRLHAPDWIESVPVVGNLIAAGVRTGRTVIESGRQTDMDSRLDQLVRFVQELLRRGPMLLVLDDLHWADTATIDLVVTLALKVEGPLMLVLAYRPDDLLVSDNTETHPLKPAQQRPRSLPEADETAANAFEQVRKHATNASEIAITRRARSRQGVLVRLRGCARWGAPDVRTDVRRRPMPLQGSLGGDRTLAEQAQDHRVDPTREDHAFLEVLPPGPAVQRLPQCLQIIAGTYQRIEAVQRVGDLVGEVPVQFQQRVRIRALEIQPVEIQQSAQFADRLRVIIHPQIDPPIGMAPVAALVPDNDYGGGLLTPRISTRISGLLQSGDQTNSEVGFGGRSGQGVGHRLQHTLTGEHVPDTDEAVADQVARPAGTATAGVRRAHACAVDDADLSPI